MLCMYCFLWFMFIVFIYYYIATNLLKTPEHDNPSYRTSGESEDRAPFLITPVPLSAAARPRESWTMYIYIYTYIYIYICVYLYTYIYIYIYTLYTYNVGTSIIRTISYMIGRRHQYDGAQGAEHGHQQAYAAIPRNPEPHGEPGLYRKE